MFNNIKAWSNARFLQKVTFKEDGITPYDVRGLQVAGEGFIITKEFDCYPHYDGNGHYSDYSYGFSFKVDYKHPVARSILLNTFEQFKKIKIQ